jgi:hypothetical protein
MAHTNDDHAIWIPLEQVFSAQQCADFMYMGSVGSIRQYKHRDTRRYINIDASSGEFYHCLDCEYRKVTKSAAIAHVFG